mmetsp:Transcript_21459/g.36853  ORF Transcript_21459/g.36853 Transcript_21459/m.36853 type:complete len:156 (+) Transcript_21459:210-677(+)
MMGFRSFARLGIALVLVNMYVGDAAELARNKDRDRKNLRVRDKRHRQLAGNGKPTFKATLSPEGDSVASGLAKFWTNEDETELTFKLFVRDAEGLIGKAGAHLHCAPLGSNGGVVAFLASTLTGGFDGFFNFEGNVDGCERESWRRLRRRCACTC